MFYKTYKSSQLLTHQPAMKDPAISPALVATMYKRDTRLESLWFTGVSRHFVFTKSIAGSTCSQIIACPTPGQRRREIVISSVNSC